MGLVLKLTNYMYSLAVETSFVVACLFVCLVFVCLGVSWSRYKKRMNLLEAVTFVTNLQKNNTNNIFGCPLLFLLKKNYNELHMLNELHLLNEMRISEEFLSNHFFKPGSMTHLSSITNICQVVIRCS